MHKVLKNIFSNFVAPSIYENEDIKKGILCQLFGGANKDFTETGRGKFRFVLVVFFTLPCLFIYGLKGFFSVFLTSLY